MLKRKKVGFIGAGNMAEAISRGLVASGIVKRPQLYASDKNSKRLHYFDEELHFNVCVDNQELINNVDIVFVSVKPQDVFTAFDNIDPLSLAGKLLITIVAGIKSTAFEMLVSDTTRIIRAMPNTPVLIGEGMTALCKGARATENDIEIAKYLFESCSEVLVVDDEALMDTITAISGSGPAYYFYFTEALVDEGVALGLSREDALKLAKFTALGASMLMVETDELPEVLRTTVTSPNGTTYAAITQMEKDGLKQKIRKAVKKAYTRSQQLGKSKR